MSSYPGAQPYQPARRRARVDGPKLWAGGFATAMVAALVAVVGILIARSILGIAVLAPEGHGAWGNASTGSYALAVAVVALLATGLMHLLMLTTPSPTSFFGWIIALLTVVAVVLPIGLFGVALEERLATAVINFVIGLAIGALLVRVADSALRLSAGQPPPAGPPPPGASPPPTGPAPGQL